MITPIILCGGAGMRLWPLSRSQHPKQYLHLHSPLSLFQQAIQRVESVPAMGRAVCVSGKEHRFLLAEQLRATNSAADILLEPCPRNTAAAIAAGMLYAHEKHPDNTLLVLTSDHYIPDPQGFAEAVTRAASTVAKGYITVFGITPSHPHCGYGYIRRGDALASGYHATAFVEKPDYEQARKYLQSGQYYWNAGMFMFSAPSMMAEMARYCPQILAAARQSVDDRRVDLDFIRLGEEAFAAAPHDSVDYAVMEKSQRVAVVEMDCGWSDIGSYESLWNILPKDAQGNSVQGEAITIDSHNNYIHSERLVAVLGVQNSVIVETADAVLVSSMAHCEKIKNLVAQLAERNDARTDLHARVHRPWGWYETLSHGQDFQVKRIRVNPDAKLSLQRHRLRSEHWVVITGVATVVCNHKTFRLQSGESTFIPLGAVHRLSNETNETVEIIEVQNGSYLGEDDIERLADEYQRQP